jgi:(4-(4-[2-(gamma-L-glutamylamino)ethyl]phenoxymethyl)furan-2-yl)methanamine synthase
MVDAAMTGRPTPARLGFGWDVGGAHVKACRLEGGQVRDIAQWPCPLWQGLPQLDAALAQARARWPDLHAPSVGQAATMTGEMVDLFADRRTGVLRLSAHLAEALGPQLRLYAGAGLGDPALGDEARWVAPQHADRHWDALASANWRATAEWLAGRHAEAVLVDIGSTTSDLIPLRAGRLAALGHSDAERLVTGALVYQGVVRTPLCALTQRLLFRGVPTGVMNEWFATTADVHRLLGQLDPRHDQQPTADQAGKDGPATRQRLARMIGRDASEADEADWRALAAQWAAAQRSALAEALVRVSAAAGIGEGAPVITAGCGDFLAAALAGEAGRPATAFADELPWHTGADGETRGWAQVAAPAVALALLADAARPAGGP